MKKQSIFVLFLCGVSLTTLGAVKPSLIKSKSLPINEPLTLEGWIDADQDEGQKDILHFSTDFKVDTSMIDQDILKKTMSEKVSVQGTFVKDSQGNLVFKLSSLTPMARTLESNDSGSDLNNDSMESSETDLMEEGH